MFFAGKISANWLVCQLHSNENGGGSFYRRCYTFVKRKIGAGADGNNKSNNEAQLFNDVLKLRQANMSVVTDYQKTNQQFGETKAILQEFEKRSVKLIFFEMPIHCSLVGSNLMKMNRRLVQQSFSPAIYRYLNLGDCQEFETTDAIHLNTEGAMKCTNSFRNSLGLR